MLYRGVFSYVFLINYAFFLKGISCFARTFRRQKKMEDRPTIWLRSFCVYRKIENGVFMWSISWSVWIPIGTGHVFLLILFYVQFHFQFKNTLFGFHERKCGLNLGKYWKLLLSFLTRNRSKAFECIFLVATYLWNLINV